MLNKKNSKESNKPQKLQNSWFCAISLIITISSVMLSTGIAVGSFNASIDSLSFFFNHTYKKRYNESLSDSFSTTLTALSGSMMLAGGFFGSTLSGIILKFIGRKSSAVFMNWINIIATMLMSPTTFLARSYEAFILGRFFFGLFSGFGMTLVPMIVAETSTNHRQALYLSLIGVNLSGGGLIGLCLGFKSVLGEPAYGPALFAASCVPSMIYLLASKCLPDTPRSLIKEGLLDDAIAVFRKLRCDVNLKTIREELDVVTKEVSSKNSSATLREMFEDASNKKTLFVIIFLFMQAQLCGINGMGMYTTKIFRTFDFSPTASTTATAIVYLAQFIVALVGSYGVDKFGPKKLNCVSSFLMGISLILLMIFIRFNSETMKFAIVASVAVYIVAWSFGVNLTLFPMVTAYTNDRTRPAAFAIGGGVFWFFSWLVGFVFLYILKAINEFTFIIFGILNLNFAAFVFLKMPETHGRTPEQVASMIAL